MKLFAPRFLQLLLVHVVAMALQLSAMDCSSALRFRVGKVWEDTPSKVMLDISTSLESCSPQKLICLAKRLKKEYSERDLYVLLFSAHDAARGFTPQSIELTPWQVYMNSKLHAVYTYDKSKQEDYVLLIPDGNRLEPDAGFNTRIEVAGDSPGPCRLEIEARCLLEFQHTGYPVLGPWSRGSGQVTVTGRMRRDGKVVDVRVIDSQIAPNDVRDALAEWTVRHLRSWRFERGDRESVLDITYYFNTAGSSSDPRVVFALPNEVRIDPWRR